MLKNPPSPEIARSKPIGRGIRCGEGVTSLFEFARTIPSLYGVSCVRKWGGSRTSPTSMGRISVGFERRSVRKMRSTIWEGGDIYPSTVKQCYLDRILKPMWGKYADLANVWGIRKEVHSIQVDSFIMPGFARPMGSLAISMSVSPSRMLRLPRLISFCAFKMIRFKKMLHFAPCGVVRIMLFTICPPTYIRWRVNEISPPRR